MNSRFINLGIGDWCDVVINTLGPEGTSSEAAAGFFTEWFEQRHPGSRVRLKLSDSYEDAHSGMDEDTPAVLIVANAYLDIHNFYMEPQLSLVATFVFDTPLYGLVSKGPLTTSKPTIATHPAPRKLIEELLPPGLQVDAVVLASSTSAAAAAVAKGEVDMALTTEIAANIHGLHFISNTRPIRMLWSVFAHSHWCMRLAEANSRRLTCSPSDRIATGLTFEVMMPILQRHTIDSAPEKSKTLLQSSIDNFGWIPNQSAYMSESPSLLAAYQRAHDLFIDSSLNEEEKAVVWITCGVESNCTYTVQAHAYIALAKGVADHVVDAIAHDPASLDDRLKALHSFTLKVIHCHGRLQKQAIDAALQASLSKRNMLDVILGVSQKNMSTILNSIAGTEIDDRFKWDAFQGLKLTGEA